MAQHPVDSLKLRAVPPKFAGPSDPHTFRVNRALYKRFRQIQGALEWEVQEAMNEALELWIKKRGKLVSSPKGAP